MRNVAGIQVISKMDIPDRRSTEINATITTILGVWAFFPELRLSQLIFNSVEEWKFLHKREDLDLFYLTDENLAEAVIEYGNKYLKGVPREVGCGFDLKS